MSKKKNMIRMIISFITSFFLVIYLGKTNRIHAQDIFSIIYFVVFSMALYKTLQCTSKRKWIVGICLGITLSLMWTIGSEFVRIHTFSLTKYFICSVIAYSTIFSSLLILLLEGMDHLVEKHTKAKEGEKEDTCFTKMYHWMTKSNLRLFSTVAIFMIICWIPALLATYPGWYSYDAVYQLGNYFSGNYQAIQPVVHTVMLGWFVDIGRHIFHNPSIGLLLYTIVQMLIVVATFSYCMVWMKKYKVPWIVWIASLLFLTWNPIIQFLSMATIKDIEFSMLQLLFVLYTFDLIKEGKAFFENKKKLTLYIIFSLFMCLFRKQGIYILIFTVPILLFVLKNGRKLYLAVSGGIIIITFLFFGPVSDMLHIVPSPSKEMLSIPMQQLARVYRDHPDALSEQEKQVLFSYIEEDKITEYIPFISDPIKTYFNESRWKANKADFIKLYLQVGMKSKETLRCYIDAFIEQNLGYFYPSADSTNDFMIIADYQKVQMEEIPEDVHFVSQSKLPAYLEYLQKTGTYFYQDTAVLSFLVNTAMPIWITLIVLGILISQKKYPYVVIPIIFILNWGILLLSPVCCARYIYPLTIMIPVLLSLPFIPMQKIENKPL